MISTRNHAAMPSSSSTEQHSRRDLLGVALAASVALLASPKVLAQDRYPSRPIQVIVPFPPGGAVDGVMRVIQPRLADALGQSVVIENRPGASGSIGASMVSKAPADGYTILAVFDSHAVNPLFYTAAEAADKNLVPIGLVASAPLIFVTSANSPFNSIADVVRAAKASPDSLTYASSGAGSSSHLTAELFKQTAGLKIRHVPYKGGGPAVMDVMAGRIDILFGISSSILPHVKAGKLKALAYTSRERVESLSALPRMVEFYPQFIATSWVGLLAPKGTPPAVLERLNRELNSAVQSKEARQYFDSQSMQLGGGSAGSFAQMIRDDAKRLGDLIKAEGIRIE